MHPGSATPHLDEWLPALAAITYVDAKIQARTAWAAASGLSKISTRPNVMHIATIAVAATIARASSRKWVANEGR